MAADPKLAETASEYDNVTLYGGPAHGHIVEWCGGDLLGIPLRSPGPPRIVDEIADSARRADPPTAIYRRSIRNEYIFVYQPDRL